MDIKKTYENLSPKTRQWLLVAVALIAGVIIILALSYGMEGTKKKQVTLEKAMPRKMSLLSEKVEKDLWIAAEGQNIKAIEKSNQELRAQIDNLRKEMEETKAETKKAAAKRDTYPPYPLPLPVPSAAPKAGVSSPPPPAFTGAMGVPPSSPAIIDTSLPPQNFRTAPGSQIEPGGTIRYFKGDESKKQPDKVSAKKKDEDVTWLPTGSFMPAVLLSGLDAPTSGGSSSEPYPVLLGVTDLSILPNRFRMNLKECFIVAAGYGNISDERAYIRTETLSCVRDDHKVIDVPLKGHIMGEDGKLGVRGRLVSKQGQQIAMAIFAGTLSGLGTALKPQSNVSINLLDQAATRTGVTRPHWGDVLEGSAMGGAGKALEMVAQYYMKMAEKLFPIVEIDAGRQVDVVVLKGQELKLVSGRRAN